MLIEQIIEFELRGPGPFGRACALLLVFFSLQNKNLKRKSSSGLLFSAKTLQEAMYLISSTWAKSLTKLNPKTQDFERVLNLNCKQIED